MRSAGPFRRILVGFDGSADAAEALRVAVALADSDHAHVVALTVIRRGFGAEGDRNEDAAGSAARERAEALLGDLRRTRPDDGARVSAQVVFSDRDDLGHTVTGYAAEHGFDVLVIGRHGDGTRRRSRLGRVADTAVQGCAVPVLLLSAP
jgi:nucleotide-binding universal stress UspA family protein